VIRNNPSDDPGGHLCDYKLYGRWVQHGRKPSYKTGVKPARAEHKNNATNPVNILRPTRRPTLGNNMRGKLKRSASMNPRINTVTDPAMNPRSFSAFTLGDCNTYDKSGSALSNNTLHDQHT